MTNKEGLKVLSVLTAAYPQQKVEDETLKLYLRFLADIPFQYGQAAALNLIAESKWFPTVADLRKEAVSLMPQGQLPSSAEAWSEVLDQIRKNGIYAAPEFSHPAIQKSVNAIGWRSLCLMNEGSSTDRAHFLKMYDSFAHQEQKQLLQIPESKLLIGDAARMLLAEEND